jgi:hypothetical protein
VHGDISENTTLLNDPDYLDHRAPRTRTAQGLAARGWDINIGAFLEGAWDPTKHIVKPFPIPSHWKVWMAMDWGYGKPYAVGWFAKDPEGKTYLFRELYGMRQGREDRQAAAQRRRQGNAQDGGRAHHPARAARRPQLGIEVACA